MSLSKDLKASVNKTYLSTRESDEVLLDLKSELGQSNNLALIIEELSSYTYKGKMQRVMRVVFERINQGEEIEDVFLVAFFLVFSFANHFNNRPPVNFVLFF